MWAESIYKLPSIAESFGKNLPAVSLLFTFHCSFHWMCILLLHFCIFLLLYFGIFIFFAKPWSCPFLLSFHCMHFVFVFFAFSCSIVFDKVFMAKSSCCYQSGRGKALRYIGRFELKFAALSLIQSYLNHPLRVIQIRLNIMGKKHPPKLRCTKAHCGGLSLKELFCIRLFAIQSRTSNWCGFKCTFLLHSIAHCCTLLLSTHSNLFNIWRPTSSFSVN